MLTEHTFNLEGPVTGTLYELNFEIDYLFDNWGEDFDGNRGEERLECIDIFCTNWEDIDVLDHQEWTEEVLEDYAWEDFIEKYERYKDARCK